MRINHLDGLRGLAILWVILFHAYARWPELLDYVNTTQNIPIFHYGYLGVQLFFMISGFVIFMTLDKASGLFDFLRKRWLRLFPAMLIASILIFTTAGFFSERPNGIPNIINLIPGLTFISPETIYIFTGLNIKGLEGAFWSLYVEVIFYFIIGLVYFLFGRNFCIPSLFLLLSLTTFSYAIKSSIPHAYALLSTFGFQHYSWFIIGCVTYEIINNNKKSIYYIAISIASIIFCLYMQLSNINYFSNILLVNFLLIFTFISSFYSKNIKKILSIKPLLIIGFSSYPLYLIHENFMISVLVKLQRFLPEKIMLICPIFITILLIVIAYIIAKFIEPKLIKMIKKITERRKNTETEKTLI